MKTKSNSQNNSNWFKQVILDVLVTGLVVISTFWLPTVLLYVFYGYSGILLIVRVITVTSNGFVTSMTSKKTSVPNWFYHVNYFICTAIFFITMQYVLGAMWAVIWILSWISTLKSTRIVTKSDKR